MEQAKTIFDMPLAELRELSSTMRRLTQSAGFAMWDQILRAQQNTRLEALYKPILPEKVYEQEFQKGEMQGMQFARSMWALLVEQVDEQIKLKEDDKSEGRTE